LEKLISSSPIVTYRKGATLFQEGEPCTRLYHILSGRCECYRKMPDGTFKHLETLGPGDYVGEPDLFGQGNHHTSARVITDSVLQQIHSAELRSVVEEHVQSRPAVIPENRLEPVLADEPIHSGRIVVALSLSRKLPHPQIVDQLAASLFAETAESVLWLRLTRAARDGAGGDCLSLDGIVDGDFHFQACIPKANGSVVRMNVKVTGDARQAENVAPLLSNLSRHFDYVIVEGDLEEVPLAPLLEFVIQADASYLFVHPNAEDLRAFDSFLDDLRSKARGNCSEIKSVVCLSPDERIDDRIKLNNGYAHAFVHDCPMSAGSNGNGSSSGFVRDVRRLAREIGRCRIGLALSAGGAKGLAHIGVLQVLEENGIEVDIIAGCSMGAYVASVWAMGCGGKEMETLAREVEGRWGLWKLIDPAIPPRQGFIRGETVIKRLQKTIGDARFSDLARPLRIVATDLNTLERVIFSAGEVAKAVHASCAIPGVCVPVTIDGEVYIDGGVADPLPVEVLAEMGIDRIIAVNALPPAAFLRCCREKEREETAILHKHPDALKLMNRQVNYFAQGNILDIMMSAVHGSQIRVAEQACRQASVILRPLGIDSHWHDFNHPGKYIAMGRQVALQHLDELKALVRRPISRHEHRTAHNPVAAVV